tara:strand:- start:377 stop:826 length:450 start_codon:yes stop_codon:yes gene_type:complete
VEIKWLKTFKQREFIAHLVRCIAWRTIWDESLIKLGANKMNYEENYFNYEEIKTYFYDFLSDQDNNWIDENIEDIHHHSFNTDYFIIGTYRATQWLGNKAFEAIRIIKDYEEDNFGQVSTDLSNPEKVVNMYAFIVGECVISEWRINKK